MTRYATNYNQRNREKIKAKRKANREKLLKTSLCHRCGKPKERSDRAWCLKCRVYDRKFNPQTYISEYRKENALCRWCGEPSVSGKSYCQAHIDRLTESGKKLPPRTEEQKPKFIPENKIRYEYNRQRIEELKRKSDTLHLSYFEKRSVNEQ